MSDAGWASRSPASRITGRSLTYDQANRLTSVNTTSFSPSLAGGWYHSLAARADGTVAATGYNALGQLGDNTTTNRSSMVAVAGLAGVRSVAAGAYHSLAVRSDGSVWAWGYNNRGQLGTGNTTSSSTPVRCRG